MMFLKDLFFHKGDNVTDEETTKEKGRIFNGVNIL